MGPIGLAVVAALYYLVWKLIVERLNAILGIA